MSHLVPLRLSSPSEAQIKDTIAALDMSTDIEDELDSVLLTQASAVMCRAPHGAMCFLRHAEGNRRECMQAFGNACEQDEVDCLACPLLVLRVMLTARCGAGIMQGAGGRCYPPRVWVPVGERHICAPL